MLGVIAVFLLQYVFIFSCRGFDIWKLETSYVSTENDEVQVPGVKLWTLRTPLGFLSCAALCFQKKDCAFFKHQNHVCLGYNGIGVGHSLNENLASQRGKSPTIQKGKFRKYIKRKAKDIHRRQIDDTIHTSFKRYEFGKTRDGALQFCKSKGSRLVKLDTKKKVKLLIRKLQRKRKGEQCFWIGLSDIYDNDTWFWTDGTPLGRYDNWNIHEPNNIGDKTNEPENCVVICFGTWYDTSCKKNHKIICEVVK